METPPRKPSLRDVRDDEWAFIAPELTLMDEAAPQRRHKRREIVNGGRYLARGGVPWRLMPNALPPWAAVYRPTRRWMAAGVFAAIGPDLREVLRLAQGRAAAGGDAGRPPAAIDAGKRWAGRV